MVNRSRKNWTVRLTKFSDLRRVHFIQSFLYLNTGNEIEIVDGLFVFD